MMVIAGLTGSIGMGKTHTAKIFRQLKVPVHDADAAVHALYAPGGLAVEPVAAAFPDAVRGGGQKRKIDRTVLRRVMEDRQGQGQALSRLEAIVHPLVRQAQRDFLQKAHDAGARLVILDVPLLLESDVVGGVDAVVVVSAPADVQRARVESRPGMTHAAFERIMSRQMPDADKRARADLVIDTGRGEAHARDQVEAAVHVLAVMEGTAWTSYWQRQWRQQQERGHA